MKKTLLILCFLSSFAFSQNQKIDSLKLIVETSDDPFKIAKAHLLIAKLHERIDLNKGKSYAYKAYSYKDNDSLLAETNNQLGRFHFFTAQLDSAAHYFGNTKQLLKELNDEKRIAIVNISIGAIQLRQGDYNNTIKTLTESATYFEKTSDSLNAAKCYSNIASAFAELSNYDKAIAYSEKALEIFDRLNLKQFQVISLPNLATQHYKNGDTIVAIEIYQQAEKLARSLNDKRSLSIIYNNLGDVYLHKDHEQAKKYLEETLRLKTGLNLNNGVGIAKNSLGIIALENKHYKTAINYFNDAAKQINGAPLVSVYNNLKESYKGLGNPMKALEYSEKARTLNDSILNTENRKSLLEVQTKYETEKKENEILELQTENLKVNYKRVQNRNLLIGAFIILGVLVLFIFMLLKNTKKKHIIMQQELKIKNQEVTDLLRAKELEGIDTILDVQEKERSKIAADLHDNLGSKVATLKLYLESYDSKETFASFYEKLKGLMTDTYNEIRTISKNKNFGARINKGLIPSTKLIAEQISSSKKIDIKVINVDVNKRMENSLEIQVFRIIQELLTNVIKHAEATETIVQFSEHENTLNIIVEDNGKGFDTNSPKSGTGLSNIEKRIEKIQGELVIDSSKGHGTTAIINIPI